MDKLQTKFPDLKLKMVTMETLGDKILNIALPKIGEKSLFTKDLEVALEQRRVQFLVHSLKDLPTTLPPNMAIGAIIERDNPWDCVLFHPKHKGKVLSDLGAGSVIGTSSLRRIAQLKRNFNHLEFKSVRGNLNTRLKKLEEEDTYDALILAKAGVDRMGWNDKVGQILNEDNCLYAIGQGAIAVEIRHDDKYIQQLLGSLTHVETLLSCACERAFMRKLNGGCSTPVACVTRMNDTRDTLTIRGVVVNNDGTTCLEKTLSTEINMKGECSRIGHNVTSECSRSGHNVTSESAKVRKLENKEHLCATNSIPEDSIAETPTAEPFAAVGGLECSYSVSKSGICVESRYLDELLKAEGLGERLAEGLIELGADRVLAEVRANIPQVMNIQLPVRSKPK